MNKVRLKLNLIFSRTFVIRSSMNILIIGPSWVGDMMMSHSLYQQLKLQYPHCQIDVMAPNWCKPLLARMPEVRHAIEMPLGHGKICLV